VKLDFFHPDISATPSLTLTGNQKFEIFRHHSPYCRPRFEMQSDILTLKQTPWMAMALCRPQLWYSLAHVPLRTVWRPT